MHGAAFFFTSGRGGAEEKKFGAGRGRGKILNPQGQQLYLGNFRGGVAGQGSIENFQGRGAPGQGGAGRACLLLGVL